MDEDNVNIEEQEAASAPEMSVPAAKDKKPRFTLKPSRQTCYALGALIVVVFLSGIGVWVVGTNDDAVLEQAEKAEKGKLESNERILSRQQRVSAEYETARGKLRYLETTVSANEYVPTLLKQMENLGKSVDLQVDSIRPTLELKPQPKKEDKKDDAAQTDEAKAAAAKKARAEAWPYDKEHIDMQIRGTYWSVARMLYRLNEFPKIMLVEGITLQPKDPKSGKSPQLTVTLKLTGFIFPDDGKKMDNFSTSGTTVVTLPGTSASGAAGSSPATAASGAPNAPAGTAPGAPPGVQPTVPLPGTGTTMKVRAEQDRVMTGK